MAHRAALLVVEDHRLVAVPHRLPVGAGRRGFEINKRVFADLCHERREIMGGDGQLARLLATAVHHEIPLLGSAAETTFEVAVHMSLARAALDIEEHVVGKRRENLQPLVRPTQLLLLAHALGRVHDCCVEPAGASGVFHQMAPVVHPAHLAVGADDAVAHVVAVAAPDLLGDRRADPFPIVGMHDALERIARQRAKLLGVEAPEQAHEPRAHLVDRAGLLGPVTEHAARKLVEKLLRQLYRHRRRLSCRRAGRLRRSRCSSRSFFTLVRLVKEAAQRHHGTFLFLNLS